MTITIPEEIFSLFLPLWVALGFVIFFAGGTLFNALERPSYKLPPGAAFLDLVKRPLDLLATMFLWPFAIWELLELFKNRRENPHMYKE